MSFRDQLKALVVPEKAKEAEAIFDALDNTLYNYDKDIRDLKAKVRSTDNIKPEDFARIEEENAKLKQDLATKEREFKRVQDALKTAEEAATTNKSQLHTLMRDEGLRKSLLEANIKKEYLDAAQALLSRAVQVSDAGEVEAVVVEKGKEVRKPLADFVKEWAGSEAGKNFVAAPVNSGGGSGGAGDKSTQTTKPTKSRADWDKMGPMEQRDFLKQGGRVVDAVAS